MVNPTTHLGPSERKRGLDGKIKVNDFQLMNDSDVPPLPATVMAKISTMCLFFFALYKQLLTALEYL